MSEEQNAPVEQNADNQNLVAELEAMRRKNAELLDEYKKACLLYTSPSPRD